jgi:hypothetical protein
MPEREHNKRAQPTDPKAATRDRRAKIGIHKEGETRATEEAARTDPNAGKVQLMGELDAEELGWQNRDRVPQHFQLADR